MAKAKRNSMNKDLPPASWSEIRKTIEIHRKITDRNDDHYRLDRYSAAQYFEIHRDRKWRERICSYFSTLNDAGEKVVHVDICGRATADRMGADISYCFSLKTPSLRSVFEPSNVFIDGDLFNAGDFSGLIKRLREDKVRPALVTFEPVAGLQYYYGDAKGIPKYMQITYGVLEHRLRDIIKVVKPGGYIYLERPFQIDGLGDFLQGKPKKEYEISIRLKKLARTHHCKIEIGSEISGLYFLLNKSLKA